MDIFTHVDELSDMAEKQGKVISGIIIFLVIASILGGSLLVLALLR
ncbi:MAG: hypothetical protein WC623_24665 [Pedobacter sp.]